MRSAWIVAVILALVFDLLAPVLASAESPEQQVVDLVNAARVQNGLQPLIVSPELTDAARAYARAMANGNFFGHVGPDGSTVDQRAEAAGYLGWTLLEENLAAGQTSATEAVAAWLASPSHRADLLSPKVRETGVGFAFNPQSTYRSYWVQEFGDRPTAPTMRQLVAFQAPEPAPSQVWIAPNGHRVSGEWLDFVRSHGDVDTFGLPTSEVLPDPTTGQPSQLFQRALLDWHQENPPSTRITPRLLGDLLFPGADPPVAPDDAPPGPSTYFPLSPTQPTGLGHFVADWTRSGEPLFFKEYFDQHGGVASFGYPKEEPTWRQGRWTQRFQAALFEAHPENDHGGLLPGTQLPWRRYRVQLALLGDAYARRVGLPRS